MRPLDIIRDARSMSLTTEDGDPDSLELSPPLSLEELDAFQSRLPCKLPPEIRELLLYCRGFSGGATEFVDFTGGSSAFGYEEIFPYGLAIAEDGWGNYWVVDLLPTSTTWGPIYFACHDAPVILYQSPTLDHFLTELFKMSVPPYKSLVDDVHEDRLFNVWTKNPGVMSYDDCINSGDAQLKTFAQELGVSFQIIDMRDPEIGFGFSWARYRGKTVLRRFGDVRLFAYAKGPGFFGRIFGRKIQP